jgi:hypothetical protein
MAGASLCDSKSIFRSEKKCQGEREFTWAARLLGTAEELREALGTPLPPVDRPIYEQAVAAVRVQLGEKAFAEAMAEGRSMTAEQALAA